MENRTYSLLVADDEYWIREKLRHMLNWADYQINFLEPAENGEEVLQQLAKDPCDILITDINMPFVNGVDLIKEVKEKYPQIVVFVISGYDDFVYVKESLVAGAIDYLLKPIHKIDLVSTVSKALELVAIQEEHRLMTLKAASLIKDRELSVLVEREPAVFSPSFGGADNSEGLGSSMVLIKIHGMKQLMSKYSQDMNLLSYEMKRRIKNAINIDNLMIFNYIFRANEFLIVSDLETVQLKEMTNRLQEIVEHEAGSYVTVAVSERNYSMDSLHEAYLQAVSVLMARPYEERSCVVFFGQEKNSTRKSMQNFLTSEQEGQLRLLYQAGNRKAICQYIRNDLGIASLTNKGWNYLDVKQAAKRLCNILIECAAKQAGGQDVEGLLALAEDIDRRIELLSSQLLLDGIENFVEEVVPEPQSETLGSMKDVVVQAAAYIDEHYFENLSLTELADIFHVESTYFSKVFKQEIGQNLMQYVTARRIEKAKNYIAQGQSNMAEVAFLVGYDDYTYFNRVFKKTEGVSPREYKNNLH